MKSSYPGTIATGMGTMMNPNFLVPFQVFLSFLNRWMRYAVKSPKRLEPLRFLVMAEFGLDQLNACSEKTRSARRRRVSQLMRLLGISQYLALLLNVQRVPYRRFRQIAMAREVHLDTNMCNNH